MWPVQTLTLLLCLTDEEQLFAQCLPVIQEPTRTEQVVLPHEMTKDVEEAFEYPLA